jgi:WD40 repeat protein/serine/threonine protein kinase
MASINEAKSIYWAALDKHSPDGWPAFLDEACAGNKVLRAEVERLLRARSAMGSFHEGPRHADNQPPRLMALFDEAVEIASPAEREAYLASACAGRPELRKQVDALLEAYEVASSMARQTWERIDPFVRRFENAWQHGQQPTIDDFLPKEGRDRLAVLRELVKVDVERRQQAGEPARTEDYLERYPELACLFRPTSIHEPGLDNGGQQKAPREQPGRHAAGEHVGDLVDGRYKLLEQIGEGGMGTVWVAEQTKPIRRKVALKLIKVGMDTRTVLARFEAERQALALMDHPNIAKVLDGGTTDNGRPFFVMEYVKGVPLTKYCDTAHLSIRERLALFVPVCHAVQHAHQKGIIHRDLKPSNILVYLYDGQPVPKVIDFGLAKAMHQPLTDHTLHTGHGILMGTLFYMSPEQAELNNLDVDTRTDIYALGVILYELLTGSTPLERQRFKQAAWEEMLRLIKEEEPVKPSARLSGSGLLPSLADQRKVEPAKLARLVRGELDWIVMKALEKERSRRYETANGVARDVQRYLADEPVEACPPSRSYRLHKFVRKNRVALMTGAAMILLLVAGVAASLWQADIARTAAEAEKEATRKAQEEEQKAHAAAEAREKAILHNAELQVALQKAEEYKYASQMNMAQTAWENANLGRVLDLLGPYRNVLPGKRNPRGWEWHYQDRLCHLDLRTLTGHTDWVQTVAFSRDGTLLASASLDKTIMIWDTATWMLLHTLSGHKDEVKSVAFGEGNRLASGSEDGTVRIWDARAGKELLSVQAHKGGKKEGGGVMRVAFSPDGSRLASASRDKTIKIWDPTSGRELNTLSHKNQVFCVAFSPDGSRLASGDWDGKIRIWDPATGQILWELDAKTIWVWNIAFSPDGNRLASASFSGHISIWDAASGRELRRLKGHNGGALGLAFTPDGSRLVSGGEDQMIKIWDAANWELLQTLKGHTGNVDAVALSPDGSRLASGAADKTIKIWDAGGGQEPRTLEWHPQAGRSVTSSRDGSRLAAARGDGTIEVWDAAKGQVMRTLKGHTSEILAMAFSPDGSRLASGSRDKTTRVWDADNGEPLRKIPEDAAVVSLAFSPDGSRLASAVSGHELDRISVWDVATGHELIMLSQPSDPNHHDDDIMHMAFTPDGSQLVSMSIDNTIRVWDLTTRRELQKLEGRTVAFGMLWSMALSGDGKRLAVGCYDGVTQIWDLASGQKLHAGKGHTSQVMSLAFSPDGSRLVSASADRTIMIWDTETGQELRTLQGHTQPIGSVAFSSDGTQVVSASWDRTIRLWDARPWTPELRRHSEALGLVEFLYKKPLRKEDVIKCLLNSKTISPPVKNKAMQLAHQYHEETDPDRYYSACWMLVRQPYLNIYQYDYALAQAEAACQLAPERAKYLGTLGAAQYRRGKYKEALASLTQTDRAISVDDVSAAVSAIAAGTVPLLNLALLLKKGNRLDLAFLAMTHHQLGQEKEAQGALARLRKGIEQSQWKDEVADGLQREASKLLSK